MENGNQKLCFMLNEDVQDNINIICEGILELNSLIRKNKFLTTAVREKVFYAFDGLEIAVYRAIIYKSTDIMKFVKTKLANFERQLLNVNAKRMNYEFVQILHCRIIALLDFIIKKS